MNRYFYLLMLPVLCCAGCNEQAADILEPPLRFEDYAHYIREFNAGDEELYVQQFPNSQADSFLRENIPLLDIPDKALEKIYYFRWWTFRKHIRSTPEGYVITEFLPDVGWAGKYNTISCPAGHHIYEGRWLHDPVYLRDYLHFWLTGAGKGIRSYSFWVADAFLAFSRVYPDRAFIEAHLPLLEENYAAWEAERRDSARQLFWQIDDRDGMEFSAGGRILNGGESIGGMAAIRPTINSYQYGDARAISALAEFAGAARPAAQFAAQADRLKTGVEQRLWNDSLSFFTVMPRDYSPETEPLDIRELIGYVPWYFNLPEDTPEYAGAWSYIMDTTAFYAPYGLTVCEQSHPYFQISYEGHECQWNGPSWPFATTQVLKGMANLLTNYENHGPVDKADYYTLLKQYASSHQRKLSDGRVLPWIDENLNPFTGDWISRTRLESMDNGNWSMSKGGVERGKDYNHSGFCDLIISDLIGIKPQLEEILEIDPLIPEDWDYYCLDQVNYHGKPLTIIWDKYGDHYQQGKGYKVFYDHRLLIASDRVEKVLVSLDAE